MKIELYGYGAEVVAGSLSHEQWSFWHQKKEDIILSHILDDDKDLAVGTSEYNILGNWEKLDNLIHLFGPKVATAHIRVITDIGVLLWEGPLVEIVPGSNWEELLEADIAIEVNDFYFDWYFSFGGGDYGICVQHLQKGLFEVYDVAKYNEWNPKDLIIEYIDFEGEIYVNSLSVKEKKCVPLHEQSLDSQSFAVEILAKSE